MLIIYSKQNFRTKLNLLASDAIYKSNGNGMLPRKSLKLMLTTSKCKMLPTRCISTNRASVGNNLIKTVEKNLNKIWQLSKHYLLKEGFKNRSYDVKQKKIKKCYEGNDLSLNT